MLPAHETGEVPRIASDMGRLSWTACLAAYAAVARDTALWASANVFDYVSQPLYSGGMKPTRADVEEMVAALFTLTAGLDRARRQSPGAAKLVVLQVLAGRDGERPSEIARVLQVSPAHVTRQVQDLEATGYVTVEPDPSDRRSCLVSLTPAGRGELGRLQEFGLDRFESFVASWDASEVLTFARLLRKLEASKSAVGGDGPRRAGRRRWATTA
jgi:DNA-binding MarR family transcriptional regulator